MLLLITYLINMDIRNATQFSTFVANNGLTDLDPVLRQIVSCIGDFARHCNCHGRAAKAAIYVNCCILYNQGAKLASTRFKDAFLSKTTDRNISFFADNGELIATVTR
jgi:hypothetical protein